MENELNNEKSKETKIDTEIIQSAANFIRARLYDCKEKYPIFRENLTNEDIEKIYTCLIGNLTEISETENRIEITTDYNGSEFMDNIFKNANIDFPNGLASITILPSKMYLGISSNYANYNCNDILHPKEIVSDTLIGLNQKGANTIMKNAKSENNVSKVTDFLTRNNLSTAAELDGFVADYSSWDFLHPRAAHELEADSER